MDHVILDIKDISVFIPRIHTQTRIFFHFAPYVLFVILLGKGTKTFVAKHKIASFAWSFALSALWKHNMAYYSGPHKKTPAQDDTLLTHPTAVDWQLPEFWCGSLVKPIRGAFLIQSHVTVQLSQALISILSGVLQLLLAEEELLWPQRDSLTETSVITPAEIFPGT